MLLLETGLVLLSLLIAFIYPQLVSRWFERVERRFSQLSQRRTLSVVLVGVTALALRAAVLPIEPIPEPDIHDEYSHLLLADTLAHGRLANPTHPMWIHFETFHVNWHPTYASMYYPGHALFLAFGQVFFGHPFWGVWLSSGLMCAAICWALLGWMPPGWALLGGMLSVIRLGTFSYWANSYWGGTVTALGGALVLGALPRIRKNQRIRDSVLMALGMALLAGTRPFEGLFFCVPVTVALCSWTRRGDAPPAKILAVRIGLPVALAISIAFACLGYYFWRVTGSLFTIPYQLNMRTYGLVYFPWDKIMPVQEFHHLAMRNFYRGAPVLGLYELARHHPFELQFLKSLVVWLFYFGPVLTMPWLVWLCTRSRKGLRRSFSPDLRFLLILSVVTYVSNMLTIYLGQPHYVAPLTATFYAIVLLLMRDLYDERSHALPLGGLLVRSVPVICTVLLLGRVASPVLHVATKPSWVRIWCSPSWQNLARAHVLKQLESTPGNHLAVVRYRPEHDFILDEWVFNNADIDDSRVVWARDMSPEQNQEFLRYYDRRFIWLVEPDETPPKISPYRLTSLKSRSTEAR